MRIGHINLSSHIGVAEEQLVVLVEALGAQGMEQHIVVRNRLLARRLSVCSGISIGPVARSAVTACILMPPVDLVHAHEAKAATAGLLLNLTRSVPYVLAHRRRCMPGNSPITRLKYRRSSGIICPSEDVTTAMLEYISGTPVDTIGDARNADDEIDAKNGCINAARMAAGHLCVYRRTLEVGRVTAMPI